MHPCQRCGTVGSLRLYSLKLWDMQCIPYTLSNLEKLLDGLYGAARVCRYGQDIMSGYAVRCGVQGSAVRLAAPGCGSSCRGLQTWPARGWSPTSGRAITSVSCAPLSTWAARRVLTRWRARAQNTGVQLVRAHAQALKALAGLPCLQTVYLPRATKLTRLFTYKSRVMCEVEDTGSMLKDAGFIPSGSLSH